ncbi:MAG: phosphatidate cytidylyltransferase, partial [Candidatus Cloacimonadaceae bacterium]|nr:phosphatidate cytidylyltransferase [Candidatus Cloacimonadaceae bacterium]
MSELLKRVIVSLIFIPGLLWILYHGGIVLIGLFFVLASLGFYEYKKMMASINIHIGFHWLVVNALCYNAFVWLRGYDIVIVWALFMIILVSAMLLWNREKSVLPMLSTLFGIIYLGILPALIVRIGIDFYVQKILLALILMIWIVDSVAYFIGMKYGKHRNVIEISPRKSIEGFIAGGLVPFLIVAAYYFIGCYPISMKNMLLVAFAAGVVGQIGDLCESMLKRFCTVKDSSDFIPGHGGVLDRMDSALLAGSFLYCAL